MESRSARRYTTLGVDATSTSSYPSLPSSSSSSSSSLSPSKNTRRRSVAPRAWSLFTVLQMCLAFLFGFTLVLWWRSHTSTPLSDAAATGHDMAHLRGLAFGGDGEFPPQDGELSPAPAAAQRTATDSDDDYQRRASRTPSAAAAASTPSAAPWIRVKPRVFVPPNSSATAQEIATWRQRFHASHHNDDQRKVADMVAWAWKGYEENAFGQDYLNVHTMQGAGLPGHDMAITLVDSLDTLFLLGMFDQFDRASDWVRDNMKDRIYKSGYISVFETTIRNMGGLLSAYYLSGQAQLLEAARELGEALSPAFTVYGHGFPGKDYDIMSRTASDSPSVAEVGSLQMEFKYLATATGETKYHDQVERIMVKLFQQVREKYQDGLLPAQVSVYSGTVVTSKITLGAYGDSYYEYLLKQWLLSGRQDDKYRIEYIRAVNGIRDRLVAKSHPNRWTFIGEIVYGDFSPKMDHLVCFVPGMLALGYSHGMPADHLELAKELLETCYQMYDQMETKLAPEIVYFNMEKFKRDDLEVQPQDAFNLQRPETVESLMILYRVTKDEKYRRYGRVIMDAFEKHTKLPGGGYATVSNVKTGPVQLKFRDGMESFFVSETLKYLFLLFSDDDALLPLDEIVFNTEAHAFPMAV